MKKITCKPLDSGLLQCTLDQNMLRKGVTVIINEYKLIYKIWFEQLIVYLHNEAICKLPKCLFKLLKCLTRESETTITCPHIEFKTLDLNLVDDET